MKKRRDGKVWVNARWVDAALTAADVAQGESAAPAPAPAALPARAARAPAVVADPASWRAALLDEYVAHGARLHAAAAAAGVPISAVRRLLAKDATFQAELDDARELAIDRLEGDLEAIGRGAEGNPNAILARLKALRPERYIDRQAVAIAGAVATPAADPALVSQVQAICEAIARSMTARPAGET